MESEKTEGNPFQFIDDVLIRQPLLHFALAIDKALNAIVDEKKIESNQRGFFWDHPREFYAGGVLQQANAPLMSLLKDCVSGLDIRSKDKPSNIIEFYESANEIHLSLWRRRFIELLTDAKLFATMTNEKFFLHHALVHEFIRASDIKTDLIEFYGTNSRQWQYSIESIEKEIIELEDSMNMLDCWYLSDTKKWKDRKPREKSRNKVLKSFRQRYIAAHQKFDSNELILTDLTYAGYSRYSQDIHATTYSFSHEEKTPMNFDGSINAISLYALTIYRNISQLLQMDDSIAWVKKLGNFLDDKKDGDANFISMVTYKPEIEKGDFVLIRGLLAEVKDIKLSKYHFRSFEVIFLSETFTPGLVEDSVPPFHVKFFMKKKDIKEGVLDKMNKMGFELNKEINEDDWNKYMRQAGIQLHSDHLKSIVKSLDNRASS